MTTPAVPALLRRASAIIRAPAARLALHDIGAIGIVFVGAALLLAFVLIAGEVIEGDTHGLDLWLLSLFETPGSPGDRIGPDWFEEMVRDVTALGSYAFIVLVLLIVAGYLLLTQRAGLAGLVVVAVAGGMLISNLLKLGFDRPRPDVEHAARVFSASFPSGHATLSAVTFLTLAAMLTRARARRRVKIYFVLVAVILTILTGLSRIYLGVHYPSDVLAGWSVGAAWAILCWVVALAMQRRQRRRDHHGSGR